MDKWKKTIMHMGAYPAALGKWVLLGGIIALLAMCLVQMIRSSDTQISRRDGDDK